MDELEVVVVFNGTKLRRRNDIEIVLKLFWNCFGTVLKLFWKYN